MRFNSFPSSVIQWERHNEMKWKQKNLEFSQRKFASSLQRSTVLPNAGRKETYFRPEMHRMGQGHALGPLASTVISITIRSNHSLSQWIQLMVNGRKRLLVPSLIKLIESNVSWLVQIDPITLDFELKSAGLSANNETLIWIDWVD